MPHRLTKEELIREIQMLPDEELGVIDQLVQLLARRAPSTRGAQPTIKLGGRWKGVFPDDFDVEKEIDQIRKGYQQRLDDESMQ